LRWLFGAFYWLHTIRDLNSPQSNGDCKWISTIHFICAFYLFCELKYVNVWLHNQNECTQFISHYSCPDNIYIFFYVFLFSC
jgi:hypothetical protein